MGYKSRENFAPGQNISQKRWDKIFGKKSFCCSHNVIIMGKTTKYYVCLKCGKACDLK